MANCGRRASCTVNTKTRSAPVRSMSGSTVRPMAGRPSEKQLSRENSVRERRRILLAGAVVEVERQGEELVADDGRRVKIADAQHLPPVVPTKIICVHLNHVSRVKEFQIKLSATPTYFHKP